jgi:hypothetical protein
LVKVGVVGVDAVRVISRLVLAAVGVVVCVVLVGCGGGKAELDSLLSDPMANPVLGFGEEVSRVESRGSGEFIQSSPAKVSTRLSVPVDREEEAVAILRAQAEEAGWVFKDNDSPWANSANIPEATLFLSSVTEDDQTATVFVSLTLVR